MYFPQDRRRRIGHGQLLCSSLSQLAQVPFYRKLRILFRSNSTHPTTHAGIDGAPTHSWHFLDWFSCSSPCLRNEEFGSISNKTKTKKPSNAARCLSIIYLTHYLKQTFSSKFRRLLCQLYSIVYPYRPYRGNTEKSWGPTIGCAIYFFRAMKPDQTTRICAAGRRTFAWVKLSLRSPSETIDTLPCRLSCVLFLGTFLSAFVDVSPNVSTLSFHLRKSCCVSPSTSMCQQ